MKKLFLLFLLLAPLAQRAGAQCAVWAGIDTVSCQQPIQLYAMPYFPGPHYVYHWSPAFGLNNPDIQNPVADHVTNQQYIVTITDTVSLCSSSDTLVVSTLYPANQTLFSCSGQMVTLDIGPGYDTYQWQNYNDGTNNHTLSDTTPSIAVNGIGSYLAIATNNQANCTLAQHFNLLDSCFLPQVDSVWPGDCNYDLSVDNLDYLYFGLAYGDNVLPRATVDTSWGTPHLAPLSALSFANGLNECHADCNGDGAINWQDTLSIFYHYGLHHAYQQRLSQDPINRNAPPLYLVATPHHAGPNWNIHINIYLGDSLNPVNSIYGLGFQVHFVNSSLLDSTSYTFQTPSSWFGVPFNNMYCSRHPFAGNGLIDYAYTGIDHNNRGGNGLIGSIDVVTTDNLSGIQILHIGIDHILAIDFAQNPVPISSAGDTVILNQALAIEEPASPIRINLGPVPSTGKIQLESPDAEMEQIRVSNALGETVYTRTLSGFLQQLDLSLLPAGNYFAEVITRQGVARKKMLLIH